MYMDWMYVEVEPSRLSFTVLEKPLLPRLHPIPPVQYIYPVLWS